MRRLGLVLIVAVSIVGVLVVFSVFHAIALSVSDRLWHRSSVDIPTPPSASFALAPPKFLLRLSLFPDGTRARTLIGVMIENHENARPYHHGLDHALFIEEFFVEGMISRFLAIFDTHNLPEFIGPVRSLRPYFVDASQPWVPVLFHAGGSPEAFDRVRELSGVTTVNGLFYDDGKHFLRKSDVPAPHDFFLPKDSLLELLPEDVSTTKWPPYPTGSPPLHASGASVIDINFFSSLHDVTYTAQSDGSYVRDNGGVLSALHPRNVLILEVPISEIGEYGRLTIPVEGKGRLLLFRSGRIVAGRWRKTVPEKGYTFETADGSTLVFAAGPTWMTVVPELARVTWR